ncbi:hypothetical protein IUJ34_17120 [Klebsiella pneumoniae subsp. pneumoniae]|uniref:Uncharacterized protein n=5 Tax=Gammaproteobacteria TaxID=1236 RepID=A0A939SRX6_KLEPN|nr:hypothetical protein [Klebsiella pneumoniae]MDQ6119371.1 hypothetical protein [Klebsiella pneumoniae subsp. pneumoniae]MDQ6191703.1 hypothetical protein [Klebsiella pneumoniae]QPG07936.1 hypothetical protein IUJ34_17120 [Klebsiella pneumoniae subsp. pneumoniae]
MTVVVSARAAVELSDRADTTIIASVLIFILFSFERCRNNEPDWQPLCLPGISDFSRVVRLPALHSFRPTDETIGAILTRWDK